MRMDIDSISYRMPPEDRGYYELSSAIIEDAVNEYRASVIGNCQKSAQQVREFFLSEMFENISGIDNPNFFLLRLDEEIEREIKSGEHRKRKKQTMKCNG